MCGPKHYADTQQTTVLRNDVRNLNNSTLNLIDIHTSNLQLHEKFNNVQSTTQWTLISVTALLLLMILGLMIYYGVKYCKKHFNARVTQQVTARMDSFRRRPVITREVN